MINKCREYRVKLESVLTKQHGTTWCGCDIVVSGHQLHIRLHDRLRCFGEQPQIAETQITQLDSTNVTRHEQYMIQYMGEFGHMRSKFYRVQRPDPLQSNVTNTDDKGLCLGRSGDLWWYARARVG